MIGGFFLGLLFLFVPETFWDRTPRPKSRAPSQNASRLSLFRQRKESRAPHPRSSIGTQPDGTGDVTQGNHAPPVRPPNVRSPSSVHRPTHGLHVGFAPDQNHANEHSSNVPENVTAHLSPASAATPVFTNLTGDIPTPGNNACAPSRDFQTNKSGASPIGAQLPAESSAGQHEQEPLESAPGTPGLRNPRSSALSDIEKGQLDYFGRGRSADKSPQRPPLQRYTADLRAAPRQTFAQQLKPWNGRLHRDNWLRVAIRPFILFAYPSVLWSSIVYACSVGWLIVLSESVAVIYRSHDTYNFSALSAGLIYLSPFIGG
jgi:hypothetical protein